MTNTKDIVEMSIEAFVEEVVSATLDGWAVSPYGKGDTVGFGQAYTVTMFRDANTVEALRVVASAITEKPKLTRAEIAAKARQALADKRAAAKLDLDNISTGA